MNISGVWEEQCCVW